MLSGFNPTQERADERRTNQYPVDSWLVDRIEVTSKLHSRLSPEIIVIWRYATCSCEIKPQGTADWNRDR